MFKLRVGAVSSFTVSSGSRICTTYYFFPLVYILQICSEVEQRAHIALCHCFPGYSAKIDCGNNATCIIHRTLDLKTKSQEAILSLYSRVLIIQYIREP